MDPHQYKFISEQTSKNTIQMIGKIMKLDHVTIEVTIVEKKQLVKFYDRNIYFQPKKNIPQNSSFFPLKDKFSTQKIVLQTKIKWLIFLLKNEFSAKNAVLTK